MWYRCWYYPFDSVPDWYKIQEMCDKVVSKEHSLLNNCLDWPKTQEMSDKAVDTCLSTLKFVPDWFVTNKMLKSLGNGFFFNYDRYVLDW